MQGGSAKGACRRKIVPIRAASSTLGKKEEEIEDLAGTGTAGRRGFRKLSRRETAGERGVPVTGVVILTNVCDQQHV